MNPTVRHMSLSLVLSAILLALTPALFAGQVEVIRSQIDPATLAVQKSIPEAIPLVRGFRAPQTGPPWPHTLPTTDTAPQTVEAMRIVAPRLASDGLLPVTADVIQTIGPDAFNAVGDTPAAILKQVGLPVDLLDHFTLDGARELALSRSIAARLAKGNKLEDIRAWLTSAKFEFAPSAPGFRLASEAGQNDIRMIRMQTPTADYWRGQGDGSAPDVIRGMATAMPAARLVLTTAEPTADRLRTAAQAWSANRSGDITILASPWTPGQWAQDNGKPGTLPKSGDGREPATLTPRYASRGEERSACEPGETWCIEALGRLGHRLIRSPLLFQGGNLVVVFDPAAKQRVLLVGEAEIYRNTALGLTRAQVEEAFRIECGADRVVVLPAVSFHIDVELSAREVDGKIVVLVNDELAAATLIARCAIEALQKLGRIEKTDADAALADLTAGRAGQMAQRIAKPVFGLRNAEGTYPLDVVEAFKDGPVDSGVANIARFLLAMDVLTGLQLKPEELPADLFARAYIRSLQRRAADRDRMHAALKELGWRVVPVPGLSDENRGINYVNGFHVPGRYLMPAYGGFYSSVDAAAAGAINAALGGSVEIVPVLCGETQRRLGAIHCAASIYPDE